MEGSAGFVSPPFSTGRVSPADGSWPGSLGSVTPGGRPETGGDTESFEPDEEGGENDSRPFGIAGISRPPEGAEVDAGRAGTAVRMKRPMQRKKKIFRRFRALLFIPYLNDMRE